MTMIMIPSPRLESEPDASGFLERWLPARDDRTMAELWKIDESDGKVRLFPGLALAGPKWHCPRRFPGGLPARPIWRCRSSVVEHVLGKDGVGSSILLGSTIFPWRPAETYELSVATRATAQEAAVLPADRSSRSLFSTSARS